MYSPDQLEALWAAFHELGARTGMEPPDPGPRPKHLPDPTPHNIRIAHLRADLIRLADLLEDQGPELARWAFRFCYRDVTLLDEPRPFRLAYALARLQTYQHVPGVPRTASELAAALTLAFRWMAEWSGWRATVDMPPGTE